MSNLVLKYEDADVVLSAALKVSEVTVKSSDGGYTLEVDAIRRLYDETQRSALDETKKELSQLLRGVAFFCFSAFLAFVPIGRRRSPWFVSRRIPTESGRRRSPASMTPSDSCTSSCAPAT